MKKIWARITLGLEVTDEEYERIKTTVEDLTDLVDDEMAQRFIDNGEIGDDSYILRDCLDD